ncbi:MULTISPECIES: hypothetical protein [unclassified Neorhizobium]|uniref:hypothetical protein n=1 Tax=Neorhizobium sp. SHOUNA12B TaxID=2908928 RepID=UPI001FF4ABB8|nr:MULTISPECIES: hypothetical protein [unclassified Neorhizobium]MCJ9669443.1 hypothetical protein [Neorhizobium sp. SHOUNA12B]MCJ9745532.1 hypothetical protein [Neorhizobium sp. SHOUNA12A]
MCFSGAIAPCRSGHGAIVATTLNFDWEVCSAAATFKNIPDVKFDQEMLELAGHIISTKSGHFRPEDCHDRYDAALLELVKAEMESRKPPETQGGTEG